MIQKVKKARDLTVLLTTHYMDEADRLCDRIAIVDHGQLVALDSPLQLKASVPGKNVMEVGFADVPSGWLERLAALPHVETVSADSNVYRVASGNGPATTLALMQLSESASVPVRSLSVQSTTLDDVFVHFTGHALRDALQQPSAADSPFMMRRG
jgi:ABC-2 type transport system ATP-binding protein